MKFDSPLFDRIRIKPTAEARRPDAVPVCDWAGCKNAGAHRAPRGRGREQEYFHFCLDHVREYNQSYNFFKGMSDGDVAAYQKDALTGHRPTWKMGTGGREGAPPEFGGGADPFRVINELNGARRWHTQGDSVPRSETRMVLNAERKALNVMGLDASATKEDAKARFKHLVKQHHPDANGGDRSTEDRLRDIIQAYNYLKTNRFV
jgi:curved DNA-binding protein CbpA